MMNLDSGLFFEPLCVFC